MATALQMLQQRAISMRQPYPGATQVIRNQGGGGQQSPAAKVVERLVQPEVWTMYDTVIISPSTASGVTNSGNGANVPYTNFAGVPQIIPFFNSRTAAGPAGFSITSMTTSSGYVDFPYKAYGMGIEASCDVDVPSTLGIATASAFVESVVNGGAVQLLFATDTKFVAPIADLPAGGGVVYGGKSRTQAVPAGSDSGAASNGAQSIQARALWSDYILFRGKDTPFSVNIILDPVALARINGLAPLSGNFSARIKVKFWGYRGKSLITGAPYRGV